MRSLPSPLVLALLVLAPACGGENDKGESKPTGGDGRAAVENPSPTGASAPGSAGSWKWELGPGLHSPPFVPDDNPMSEAKVALGHRLFMDKRLSGDGSRSCYSCHQNQLGNADGLPKALGPGDKPLPRNTPTIWNVAYQPAQYWDGRAPSLEKQALGAFKGANMAVGEDNLGAKAAEIGGLEEYRGAFAKAFDLKPGEAVTIDHICMALSSYERTLLCGDTAFDRGEMDEAAKRGWDLFRGKAGCASCHGGDNFSEGLYHNAGIGFDAGGNPIGESVDLGRGEITKDALENHKFRTPTLRNVSKTAPYFHDGSAATLEETVKYMVRGGNPRAPGIDPLLADKAVTDAEAADIVAFLRTLDCPGQLEVIGDQTVAGITDAAAGGP